jgi:glycosyltransferase involved in cell wall biosynthesis
MDDWDLQYYIHVLRQTCQAQGLPHLAYPHRGYFTQVARFDPSKGIPDVIEGYSYYRKLMKQQKEPLRNTHQLVICGHSSIDDPDGSMIYDETMDLIHDKHPDLAQDIIVVRLGPSDQILNAIMSLCTVALQLSLREGFEVKVSEALHKVSTMIWGGVSIHANKCVGQTRHHHPRRRNPVAG